MLCVFGLRALGDNLNENVRELSRSLSAEFLRHGLQSEG